MMSTPALRLALGVLLLAHEAGDHDIVRVRVLDHVVRSGAERIGDEPRLVRERHVHQRLRALVRPRQQADVAGQVLGLRQGRDAVTGHHVVDELAMLLGDHRRQLRPVEAALLDPDVLRGDEDIDAVGPVADLALDPVELDVELLRGEGDGTEHTHTARLAHRRDDVTAMAEGEDRELDAEQVAHWGPHRTPVCVSGCLRCDFGLGWAARRRTSLRIPMADENVLDLGNGFQLAASFPGPPHSVRVSLRWRAHQLFVHVFTADRAVTDFRFDGSHHRADGRMKFDVFSGELWWSLRLEVRRGGAWKRLLAIDRAVVAKFDPSIGQIGGSTVVHEPVVDDPAFGRSQLCSPTILRIHVADVGRWIADVGQIAKQTLFPHVPRFTFNTVACVGDVPDGAPGLYTDPTSVWFNVFFGYYQIDCEKALWDRPFAYRIPPGAPPEPHVEDIVRLGKADWNWFSNWMYGVPASVLQRHDGVDMGVVGVQVSGPNRIGGSDWHHVRLTGIDVASSYVSDGPGAQRLVRNTVTQNVWHQAFGLPHPRPQYPDSFIPTSVDAALDLAYWEDDEEYHTLMFGGTTDAGKDPRFLDAQVDATRDVITDHYTERGLSP